MSSNLVYQVRSKSILTYYKRTDKPASISLQRQKSIENLLKQKTYTGDVSAGSQKRLTRALENLVQVAQPKFFTYEGKEYNFKVNFVTLTLYSFGRFVPGKEAHKTCLEPFLLWLRRKHGMTAYVWKAELQMKREDCHQLHYHLTTDVYIDCIELRDKWNELQRKAGYLDYYFEKFGHWNPNSTDVHATHNKKNLIGYLKKKIVRYCDKKRYNHFRAKTNRLVVIAEMAKRDQNKESIEGKVWDCSQNIKTSYYEIEGYYDVTKKIAEAMRDDLLVKKEFEQCTVYELTKRNARAIDVFPFIQKLEYAEHLKRMREFERLTPDINTFSAS